MAGARTTSEAKQAPSKMHKRSRTGCFTCRLRRKKCEEGRPTCRACRHLGLQCEYQRPTWWSNNPQRGRQKDVIKNIIRRKRLAEKSTQVTAPSANTPPSLSRSLPSSDTRAASVDSMSPESGYTSAAPDYFNMSAMPPPHFIPSRGDYPMFSPYEVDIRTERQTFVNDIPMRRDSTMSTFSTYQPPPMHHGLPSFPADSWVQQEYFESSEETFAEEPVDFNFFDLPHGLRSPSCEAVINVDDCDRYLLNHFIDQVLRLIFPILEVNQHGAARSDVIVPALESNKCYLHCCLSISALHLKTTEGITGDTIDNDIVRHRYATISELCEALGRDTNHMQILEATLGMIFFQCSVGRPDDALPDIAWHQHFEAASNLVNRLELPRRLLEPNDTDTVQPPFNMTLTSWIDILGATMLGRTPAFADTYREKHLAGSVVGLAELMGCEDRVMFLISEIACLEALKLDGMDEVRLCSHISLLGEQISLTESGPDAVATAYSTTGAIRPKQLSKNMTNIFRLAARVYLCSLVPDFDRHQSSIIQLVASLTHAMGYIPAGPEGFDRSLAWPLLVAGSVSTKGSSFRTMFAERSTLLGAAAEFGSFGRVREVLKDVWHANDDTYLRGERQSVHWRDAMRQKGWDFLLI